MLDFHDIYSSYAPDVYRFAYWLSGSIADAEDIASETFIRAWVRSDQIRTETLKGYLLQIARNIYLQNLRRKWRQVKLEDIYADPRPGPDQLAGDRADLATAQRILQTLPEKDRAAFILRVQQELHYDEIARILGISLGAVKVKIYRARKKMLTARLNEEAK